MAYAESITFQEFCAHFSTEDIQNLSGVNLGVKKYEAGYLHWLHKVISNLKTFLLGTYHGCCTDLQAYLDRFCFRFNRRKTGD